MLEHVKDASKTYQRFLHGEFKLFPNKLSFHIFPDLLEK